MVLPRVSTEASFLMMAFCFAILETPSANVIVSTAGSPSGMAETARLTAIMNIFSSSCWWTKTPMRKTHMVRMTEIAPSWRPIFSIFRFKGGSSTTTDCTIPAILPNSVLIPVSVTNATALPPVMTVPVKTVFFLSPMPASALRTLRFFVTDVDSPVNAASSTWRLAASISLESAGTLLPASRSMMSPGTRFFESIEDSFPSLKTRTCGDIILLRASTACSARYSWTNPRTAFMITMTRMTYVSVKASPSLNEM